ADASVPEDRVVRTEPGGGSTVANGTGVTIFLSSGPGTIPMPRVEGVTRDNALQQLEAFNVEISEQRTSDPNQDNIVLSQSPAPGTPVEPGSTVRIVVYTYVEPEVTLPTPPGGGGGD